MGQDDGDESFEADTDIETDDASQRARELLKEAYAYQKLQPHERSVLKGGARTAIDDGKGGIIETSPAERKMVPDSIGGKAPRPHLLRGQQAAEAARRNRRGGVPRRRRRKPGKAALKEIEKYQKSVEFLLRKAPFSRLVREVAQDFHPPSGGWRFQQDAFEVLQTAAEAHLLNVIEAANLAAIHGKRVTLMAKDMKFIANLMERFNITM